MTSSALANLQLKLKQEQELLWSLLCNAKYVGVMAVMAADGYKQEQDNRLVSGDNKTIINQHSARDLHGDQHHH